MCVVFHTISNKKLCRHHDKRRSGGVSGMSIMLRGEGLNMTELEILRAEYKRAQENPLFDDPKLYCVLLDLIQERIDEIEQRYANY
jgi:hypothetical protein